VGCIERWRTAMVLGAVVMAATALSVVPAVAAEDGGGMIGEFEGQLFDMSDGWNEATACYVGEGSVARCFRTEAEMDRWIANQQEMFSPDGSIGTTALSCSGYLKLYDYTGYSGPVISLNQRAKWHNLADLGFDQRTSSYKVGPCSAKFLDYANGGGAQYPSYLTQAYDQSSTMISGWDNDVSSVWIN